MKEKFLAKWNEFWHGDKGTKCRIILLILSWINQAVALIGQTTFAQAQWYQITSLVVTTLISAVTAWENNDITYFAKLGTKVVNALEDKKITQEEVLDILDKDDEE